MSLALDLHNKLIREKGIDDATGFSRQGQLARFAAIKRCINLMRYTVLDYGCNVGDLYPFLASNGLYRYTGIDINNDFLIRLKIRFPFNEVVAVHGDIRDEAVTALLQPPYDFVVASGTFCYADQAAFLMDRLRALYKLCSSGLIVNFLRVNYPKNDPTIHCYYEPSSGQLMAERLKCLSYAILADYMPNDFTVAFYK